MMGFSVIIIFALLQIRLLNAGVNPEDLSNIESTDSSNHHQRHARGLFGSSSAAEDKDQIVLDFNHNLEFVVSKDPPEDVAPVPHGNEDYYILGFGGCDKFTLKAVKSTEALSQAANNEVRSFLVNKDQFENLEWKKWSDIKKKQIPFYSIRICKSHYIAIDKNSITFKTKGDLKKETQVLTVNYDITGQHFQIYYCENQGGKSPGKLEVIKQIIADNRNCDPAKYVVKLDEGSDKTKSFLKGITHTAGGALEVSASGTIATVVQMSGKISGKYDQSRSNSETIASVNKVLHSLSMEVQVPPNHSCTIDILSKTSMVQVLCSGELIRHYKDNEIGQRITSVNGTYGNQEVAELKTSVNLCTPVKDEPKCPKPAQPPKK
ncbi:natterin-3-like [Megalobrama amblycephala]|uniref:natterin-3-like n=1 Tax=Megalobrama amblycephala TaxID=75352 RepID=UPI0020140D6D|nr:natterin-3-like [Megalobrama amblycephala]